MQALRTLARKLLTEGTVQVVIGYENGPRGARPTFVTLPEEAERLVFTPGCVQNLASYLSPRRNHLRALGKPAVVVKGCDAKAVAGLIRESQLKRENVVLIGVRCGGVVRDPALFEKLSLDTVADRCGDCDNREPKLVDHLLGELPPAPPASTRMSERMARLEAMSHEERFAFWTEQMERCVRCHACREVCPLCFCVRCLADKTMPQWIESSAHARGNLAWHFTHAMHLAGRCVGCGECQRVCPADIPLGLLNRKMAQIAAQRFGYKVCDDPQVPAPIGAFRKEDEQEFIR